MAKSTEYELALRLAAKLDKSFGKSINQVNSKIDGIGQTFKKTAKIAAAAFSAIQIKDFAKGCIDAAIGVENVMADISKVVDGLKDENGQITASYGKVKDELMAMTKTIPMTVEELGAIYAAAGQSNIAAEDLGRFTETAAKMGVAFGTTAEQSGTWMATWRTAMNLTQEQVSALGDQINYLGNTSSEDANKLAEVVTRVGALAKTAGLAGGDVAALAAAMPGVEAEVSATGIQNMLLAMTKGSAATAKQQKALAALGFSATDLAKRMQTDAQGAITGLLGAIKKLPKEAQTSMLSQIFGNESIKSIAPLLENLDNLQEQFEKVGDASLYAGSMQKEFEVRSKTTENAMQLARNAVNRLKVRLGDALLPVVAKVAGGFADIVDRAAEFVKRAEPQISAFRDSVSGMVETIRQKLDVGRGALDKIIEVAKQVGMQLSNAFNDPQSSISVLATVVLPGIINGLMGIVGWAASVYQEISAKWSTIGPIVAGIAAAIGAYKLAVMAAEVKTKLMTKATAAWEVVQKLLNGTLALSPLAKFALIAGALVAVGMLIYKNWDKIKAVIVAVGKKFKEFGGYIKDKFVGAFLSAKETTMQLVSNIAQSWQNAKDKVLSTLNSLAERFPGVFGLIQTYVQSGMDAVSNVIEGVKRTFSGVIQFVKGVFTGDWGAAWQGVVNVFGGIFDTISSVAKAPINLIIDLINYLIGKVNQFKIDVPEWMPGIGGKTFGFSIPEIPRLAAGGIVTSPTLAEIGEGGEPEAVIPLSKLYDLLFNPQDPAPAYGGGVHIQYAPVYHFEGEAPSREDLLEAERMSQAEFNRKMDAYFKDRTRRKF